VHQVGKKKDYQVEQSEGIYGRGHLAFICINTITLKLPILGLEFGNERSSVDLSWVCLLRIKPLLYLQYATAYSATLCREKKG